MTKNFIELCSQLKSIQDECVLKNKFKDIAKVLFCNHHIDCCGNIFYFAEVEFYYYRNNVRNKSNFNAEWNKVAYPRNAQTGDLFFHLSGIDICFESEFNKEWAEFGGILIRSIVDTNGDITAGPLTCKNYMLNICQKANRTIPTFVDNQHGESRSCCVRPTSLTGIKNAKAQIDNCYFDASLPRKKWSTKIPKYNTTKGVFEEFNRKYDVSKFETEWEKRQ